MNTLNRLLCGAYKILVLLLIALMFVVGLIPYMIYMLWLIRCPACGRRGTLENKRRALLKFEVDGHVEKETWLYYVCQHCGNVRKNAQGTWHDVDEEEWKMATSDKVFRFQSHDEHEVKPDGKPKKKSLRKKRA